jgi:hypothetical protein
MDSTPRCTKDDFVLADMGMTFKKKAETTDKKSISLGLLKHAYKVFATFLQLFRILPHIAPKLSDMQVGFPK